LNHQGGTNLNYQIDLRSFQPGFALTAETNKLQAPASGAFDLKITAARREYDGPITLKLSHPDLALTNNLIPAKTNTVQLRVAIPPEWDAGKLINFYVTGEATIGEEPVEARASTWPALRKSFPNLLYPPPDLDVLDGLIGLGIVEAKASNSESAEQPPDKK
jgi:hypothetical protein